MPVLDELDVEVRRFRLPLRLFVDATEARSVSLRSQLLWTRWLESRRSSVASLHVATADRALALGVEIATHRARMTDRFVIHESAAELWAALSQSALRRPVSSGDRVVVSTHRRGLGLALSDGECNYRIEDEPDAVRVTIDGFDRGALGGDAFAALGGLLDDGRKHLAFDLRRADPPAAIVAEHWTGWLSAHRPSIASMKVVCASPRVDLTVSIAALRAGLGPRLHVVGP